MNLNVISVFGLAIALSPMLANAKTAPVLTSPEKNVLCDKFVCVSGKEGVSVELTQKYLGSKQAKAIQNAGDFDKTAVTFANGIFYDVNEQKCHVDRYFEADGKRSAISDKYTKKLFGK